MSASRSDLMFGWLGWQKFVLYRLSRRNRRSLVSIQAMLVEEKVVNDMFRDLTLRNLDRIAEVVEKLRDEKILQQKKDSRST